MDDFQSRAQQAATLDLNGDRAAAVAEYERILADIERSPGFFGEADVRLAFARVLQEMRDPRADQQLTKAIALLQKSGDIPRMVDACLRMGWLHHDSTTVALYWVDRAVTAAARSGAAQSEGRALACRGELLIAAGRADEALAAFERATTLPGGEEYAEQLAAAQVLAGKAEEGLGTLTRLLAAAEGSTGADSARRIVRLRIRLADAKRAQGDRHEVLELLKGAARPASAGVDDGIAAMLMDRLGFALLEAGDFTGAVDTLERGLERARAQAPPDASQLASLYNNLGSALAAIGNQTGARHALSEAIRVAREIGNLKSEALSLFGKANLEAKFGDTKTAGEVYDEARSLAVRLGDRSLEAACLDSSGQLLTKNGAPGQAIDLQRRAAELHQLAGDYKGQHTDLMNLLQSFLLLGETASAREALDEARSLAGLLGNLPWHHALNEGQVLAREGRWEEARPSFDAAIAQLDAERENLDTPADQRRWASQRVEAFEIAACAAFEAGDALAALTYLERNRARFLEAVAEDRRRLPAGLSADDRKTYVATANRLAELRWKRREHPDDRDPALDAEFDRTRRAWHALDADVQLRRMKEPPRAEPVAPVRELAECLSPGETAIALHVAIDWTGAACIGRRRNGELWWACDTNRGFKLKDLSRMIIGRAEGDKSISHPAWQDLASLPLEDAERLVAGTCDALRPAIWPMVEHLVQSEADALVLMPGRGLNVLPLHAVSTSDQRVAADRWSVRYAPSLSLIASAGSAGVLGPAQTLGQAVNPTGDLPFADAEAAAIRETWSAGCQPPLRGDAAVPDQVLRLFEQSDVMHFAGHGAFDPEDPLRSHLSCAPDSSGNVITLQTLLERVSAMRARVVFLSACETGRVVAEDPLNDQLGLPGGLLIAGAGAVLGTFWRVNDLAACLVLSKAVELWKGGAVDLDRALADAQRWLRTKGTAQIVREWIEARLNEPGDHGTDDSALASENARLALYDDDELLFPGALHWAAFHVIGRGVRLR